MDPALVSFSPLAEKMYFQILSDVEIHEVQGTKDNLLRCFHGVFILYRYCIAGIDPNSINMRSRLRTPNIKLSREINAISSLLKWITLMQQSNEMKLNALLDESA